MLNVLNAMKQLIKLRLLFIIDSLYIGSWTAGACPLTIYECINKGCALILGMSNSSVWIIIIFYNLTDQFCSFSLY